VFVRLRTTCACGDEVGRSLPPRRQRQLRYCSGATTQLQLRLSGMRRRALLQLLLLGAGGCTLWAFLGLGPPQPASTQQQPARPLVDQPPVAQGEEQAATQGEEGGAESKRPATPAPADDDVSALIAAVSRVTVTSQALIRKHSVAGTGTQEHPFVLGPPAQETADFNGPAQPTSQLLGEIVVRPDGSTVLLSKSGDLLGGTAVKNGTALQPSASVVGLPVDVQRSRAGMRKVWEKKHTAVFRQSAYLKTKYLNKALEHESNGVFKNGKDPRLHALALELCTQPAVTYTPRSMKWVCQLHSVTSPRHVHLCRFRRCPNRPG
jgi:hypothetical protein